MNNEYKLEDLLLGFIQWRSQGYSAVVRNISLHPWQSEGGGGGSGCLSIPLDFNFFITIAKDRFNRENFLVTLQQYLFLRVLSVYTTAILSGVVLIL